MNIQGERGRDTCLAFAAMVAYMYDVRKWSGQMNTLQLLCFPVHLM